MSKKCPQNISNQLSLPKGIYAVRNKNDNEILRSASGGVFVALAKYFLEQGGACVGAAYMDNWNVGHIIVRMKRICLGCKVLNMYKAILCKLILKYRNC